MMDSLGEKMNIYWCYCLGNHEGDSAPFTLTREENVKIWAKYPHCLLESEVKTTADGTEVWGLGNTAINLLGADYAVRQTLVFMDSGSKVAYGDDAAIAEAKALGIPTDSYDYLKESQKAWFAEYATAAIAKGTKVMLFIHIPLVEQGYVKLLKATEPLPEGWSYAYTTEDHSPVIVGGEIYGYTIVKDGWSLVGDTASYEKCYCSDYNSGMYDLMKSLRQGVNALFCGHDHVSNSILYETDLAGDNPVYLCYGVCSGLQSYNMYSLGVSDTNDYSLRGYAVIEVKADSSFDYYNVRYNNVGKRIARIAGGVACD